MLRTRNIGSWLLSLALLFGWTLAGEALASSEPRPPGSEYVLTTGALPHRGRNAPIVPPLARAESPSSTLRRVPPAKCQPVGLSEPARYHSPRSPPFLAT